MSKQIEFIIGNEANLEDILELLKELFDLHKEINTNFNLADDYINIYRKNLLIELKDKNSCYIIIGYKENSPIAFGVAKKLISPAMFNEPPKGYIPYIYVKPSFRSQGIGMFLIKELEIWFKENDLNTIEVNVMEENKKAMNFYNNLGFITISKRLRKQIGD